MAEEPVFECFDEVFECFDEHCYHYRGTELDERSRALSYQCENHLRNMVEDFRVAFLTVGVLELE